MICYICGRELLCRESFEFHLRKCVIKFTNFENLKDAEERRALPKPPVELEGILSPNSDKGKLKRSNTITETKLSQEFLSLLEKYNEEATKTFKETRLGACPYCEKTFYSR